MNPSFAFCCIYGNNDNVNNDNNDDYRHQQQQYFMEKIHGLKIPLGIGIMTENRAEEEHQFTSPTT